MNVHRAGVLHFIDEYVLLVNFHGEGDELDVEACRRSCREASECELSRIWVRLEKLCIPMLQRMSLEEARALGINL